MKKIFLITLLSFLFFGAKATTPPDEGMWLPMFIKDYNYATMQQLGLKLTAEQMYDINNNSLKDAIVQLGNFCTGEIISEEGLMLTNHHCGYGSIADHSTEEHDYLKYGFWAATKADELPNEGLTATFLVRMEDVTNIVLAGVTDETKKSERNSLVSKAITKLKKEQSENGKYTIEVKPFFEGNEYYMFVYQVFRDVRLVGAPPSSIGKFGDETDNWVWPRHTGDFSIFRIYTAPDGSPADYAPENIPLKPKHVLPINIKGVEEGDYAMIWGFPGTTDRFMTSYEINNMINVDNVGLVTALDQILPVIRAEMDARDIVRINYTSDYASMANTQKNKKGESASLLALKVADKKAEQEKRLLQWIEADSARIKKYGNPFKTIEKLCAENDANGMKCFYFVNISLMNSKVLFAPYKLPAINKNEGKNSFSASEQENLCALYREQMGTADFQTEVNVLEAILNLMQSLPTDYQPAIYDYIAKKFKGDNALYAKHIMEKSIFASEANFAKFIANPSQKVYDNDPLVKFFNVMFAQILKYQTQYQTFNAKLETPRRKYLAALKEMEADKAMYPDANSTMRCTYGTVVDYYPVDGVHYKHFTTHEGILQKEIPGDPEFDVPAKLKELLLKKDFGRYAAKDGSLHVCFLTNNDITGGNSGSPVINGNGELIGCAFDGNIEALSSNIAYDSKLQRCINVDARYILFVIDKFAGATHLINEMKIIE